MKKVPAKSTSRGIQKSHQRRFRSGKTARVNPGVKRPQLIRPILTPMRRTFPSLQRNFVPALMLKPKKRDIDSIKKQYEHYLHNHRFMMIPLWFTEGMGLGEEIAVIPSCPLCGEGLGYIMVTENYNKPFPGTPVVPVVCESCYGKHLKKGVLIISGELGKVTDTRMVVLKEDAFKKLFTEHKGTEDVIARERVAFMDPKEFTKLFGKVTSMKPPKLGSGKPKSLKELFADIQKLEVESAKTSEAMNKSLKELGLEDQAAHLRKLEADTRKRMKELNKSLKEIGLK